MRTDREKDGLLGPAHRVHTNTIEILKDNYGYLEKSRFSQATTYDFTGNRIKEEHYNIDGSLSLKVVLAYGDGRLKEVTSYSGLGALLGKTDYTYDVQGRLVEESFHNAAGEISRQKSFSYNASGKKVEDFFFDAGPGHAYEIEGAVYNAEGASLIESFYDSDGKLTEVLFYDDNRSLISRTIMKYDSDDNLVEDAQYIGSAILAGKAPELKDLLPFGTALFRRLYVYDAEKNKNEERLYFGDSLTSKRVLVYDGGTKVEETEYGPEGSLRSKVRFSYEFNPSRDWTKQTLSRLSTKTAEFEPHIAIYRIITYY